MSTHEFVWSETCERATRLFNGQTPGPVEQMILEHFLAEPVRVIQHIEEIGRRIARGDQIRSGWAILRLELEHRPADVRASDNEERASALRLAEAWIRNAGGYLDRESEVVSELFDENLGRLRAWPELREQVLELWRSQRPRFEASEREAEERQARQAQALRELRAPKPDVAQDVAQDVAGTSNAGNVADDDAYLDSIAPDPDEAEAVQS